MVTRHAVTQGQARTVDKVTRAAMEAGTIVRVIKVRHNIYKTMPRACNAVSGVRLMHLWSDIGVIIMRERAFLMIKLGHSHLWDLVLGCSGSSGNMCHLKNCSEHWMFCDNNAMLRQTRK